MRRLPLLLAPLLLASVVGAGEPREITVEWIYSDEGERLTALPETAWTSSGDVLLLDRRRPKAERTLERFSPETRARTAAVDAKAALASLRGLLDKAAPEALDWPAGFDRAGRLAVYLFGDDVFLLDLRASRFDRVTRTGEKQSAVRVSPDGRKVAFVRANDLYVYDVASKTETRLTIDGSETILNGALSWLYWEEVFDHHDQGYWWSPDSTAIAFLRTDEAPVSVVPFVDFAPAVPRVLRQRYPKAGGANPIVRLGVASVDGKRTVFADPSDLAYEYVLRVKWLPDSGRVAFETMNRRQDRAEVLVLDPASGASRRVLTETDPAWVNTVDFDFLKDGRHVLATSDRTGHTHLYRYTVDGELVNAVTEGPWSVRGPSGFTESALDASAVDEARGVVFFTALEKSAVERHVYRVGLDGRDRERLSREDGVHRVSWSPDRRYYLDEHSSHATPPSSSVHDATGALLAVLAAAPVEPLASLGLRYPEMLTIPARDGFPLPARLLKPALEPGRRYPVILNVYGEPNEPMVADAWYGGLYFDQVLLRNGYLVASVDPRSATGVDKASERTVLRHKNGAVEVADLEAAARWLKAQPFVDPDRIGIWGWSGGGTFTLAALTRSQEFKAGIAVAPETEHRYYDTKYVEAYMKTPAENAEGYDEVSLVKRAKDLHGRLLLVFGSGDDNVHPQNSLHFADELVKAARPFEMMVYPMRKHGIDDRDARRHLFNRMLEFWKGSL
jgi:dipeptidyl-peptidase-4